MLSKISSNVAKSLAVKVPLRAPPLTPSQNSQAFSVRTSIFDLLARDDKRSPHYAVTSQDLQKPLEVNGGPTHPN